MKRVIHFEIPAENPERVVEFYKDVFGWSFQKWAGPQEYWLANTGTDGPGINGGIMRKQHPGQGTCNTIDVANVDEAARQVQEKGGKLVVPKMEIPGVGFLVYCQDPDGNTFGMLQAATL